MNTIRVLHIVGKMDRAGAETMLMNLYRHIDRTQVQFDFVTFTTEQGDYDEEILALGGRIFPIIANNSIERMFKLTSFLKQHSEYQIIHAHKLLNNAFHLLAAKQAGIPHRIAHSHSTSNGKMGVMKKIYEKWALQIINKTVTSKIACGELAAKYLFGSTTGVMILPNSVNCQQMIEKAKENRNFISENFNDEGLKIIQVGRLNTVKNHKFSLKIAEELTKRGVKYTLYIIGQGPLDLEIKKEIQKKSLTNNIKMLGIRSDITELMASADFMIMPSLHEGFPVVLVESQTVGLHAVVSDRISMEVDLDLGLVKFLPISSVKEWADYLEKPNPKNISNSFIYHKIKSSGFDVLENSVNLSNLYKSYYE